MCHHQNTLLKSDILTQFPSLFAFAQGGLLAVWAVTVRNRPWCWLARLRSMGVCMCESERRGCFPFNNVISGTAAFSVITVETVMLGGSSRKHCKFF